MMSEPVTLPPAISFDLSHWSQIDITGHDRHTFLNGFCTNDVKQLQPGRTCEAFIPDIKGKILGHVLIAALPDRLRLISVPDTADSLIAHLRMYVLDADVCLTDTSARLGLICLWGGAAGDLVPLETPLRANECSTLERGSDAWVIVSSPLNGEGLLLSAERQSLADWRESIPAEVLALGTLNLLEILRIESGFPLWGVDISAENLAQEAGRTAQAISFNKGCYLGQEPIARLDALGHTNKELRGLVVDGETITLGSEILDGSTVVGRVTSGTYSPLRGKIVALGMVRTKSAAPGTTVQIAGPAGAQSAKVFWPTLE